MINISDLVKRFGAFTAVDGLSFSVEKGEVLGFLGPNGAGKSTTMRMITGFLAPTSGQVSVCGYDVAQQGLEAQRCLGYLPEGAPAYGEMTPRGYLKFIGEVRGLTGAEGVKALDRAVERAHLGSVLDQPIDTLSKGFKRRVGLAQAILHNPPVLIMDEPTDGLDPNQKHAVRSLIKEMSADKAIIISTHILEEVDAICSRALIIDRGRQVADGTPSELAARSSYHNAVTIGFAGEEGPRALPELQALNGITRLDERQEGGQALYTLFVADKERLLIEEVSALAQSRGWNVRALYAEEGRLDEVFRMLTTSDVSERHDISEEAVV
ncbi:MAG: ATP-binding cassette domain-containing protein [Alphaproteobacteria bacterium]|nr:MAG: ATP-binding cassette domain-containing protein [Alphaproteobacteria bacterium]